MTHIFNVRTADEKCQCAFGGVKTELPLIQETPLLSKNKEKDIKNRRKNYETPHFDTTVPPSGLSDTESVILGLLNEVSQVIWKKFFRKNKYNLLFIYFNLYLGSS